MVLFFSLALQGDLLALCLGFSAGSRCSPYSVLALPTLEGILILEMSLCVGCHRHNFEAGGTFGGEGERLLLVIDKAIQADS